LARTPEELLAIVSDAKRCGCKTLFVKNPTPDTKEGKLLLFMSGWSSEAEWEAIKDRTSRGVRKIRDQGLWVGLGPVRFGYVWDKKARTRRAHPETAAIVRRIFHLVGDEGMSLYAVATLFNAEGIPSPSMWRERVKESGKTFKWTGGVVGKIVQEPGLTHLIYGISAQNPLEIPLVP
jgi:DNA invertase Pin-like site-specific DNA recombinase